ncbi:MAG TPA: hypothetical protein PKD18_12670 [Saprospiraceae bacterium]|nr:hypothetical protein [Saprospiraceae bacterium]
MDPQQQYIPDDEITLKELILKIKEYWYEVWRNWWLVGLVAAPVIAFFLYKHYNTIPLYNANVRYVVEGSGGGGGISGLLGQFGIRRDSKVNPYKIQEVARSKNILRKVLFSKVDDDFIANQLLEIYKYDESWAKGKDKSMVGFRFKNGDFKRNDTLDNKIFMSLVGRMIGSEENRKNIILNIGFEEDSGVYTHSISTPSEALSLNIMDSHYEAVRVFFEEEAIFSQASTVQILKIKADSLQMLINSKSYAAANIQDKSFGLVSAAPAVKGERLQREVSVLSLALAEVIKSYEIADINLRDIKPSFLQIDMSLPPIKATESSLLISIVKGGLLGFLLAVSFVIARKIFRETMDS